MLLNSYSFAFPTLHSFPCSFSLLYLGTSDHVHSGAHGSDAVLQHHKPQLDSCQCPFLDRSLQKATSWQGSAGSPTELGADPSPRQNTNAGLPELTPTAQDRCNLRASGLFPTSKCKTAFFFMLTPLLTYKRDSIFLPTHS